MFFFSFFNDWPTCFVSISSPKSYIGLSFQTPPDSSKKWFYLSKTSDWLNLDLIMRNIPPLLQSQTWSSWGLFSVSLLSTLLIDTPHLPIGFFCLLEIVSEMHIHFNTCHSFFSISQLLIPPAKPRLETWKLVLTSWNFFLASSSSTRLLRYLSFMDLFLESFSSISFFPFSVPVLVLALLPGVSSKL